MNDLGQAAVSAEKAPRTDARAPDRAQIARGGGAGLTRYLGIDWESLRVLPIPDSARQHKLVLEPHEELPEVGDDESDEGDGDEPQP